MNKAAKSPEAATTLDKNLATDLLLAMVRDLLKDPNERLPEIRAR